ncbi:MAG: sigma-54 dependent transcriptional regulator [Polyangiaceae bacterium]|jgi:DNA-binding NtrC family response regulator|nr:sigma-54 dependent transcriptional regulator [Polyangiaceae bacterium]
MSERILIVEDEETLRNNIHRYLERAGHSVSSAATGKQAAAELERSPFDLVITDFRLPDTDGLQILEQVRTLCPDSIVLIMTAYASVDAAVEAMRRGAHDYLLKPLSLADLQRRIDRLSEHRRLTQENARLRTQLRGENEPFQRLRAGGGTMRKFCTFLEKIAPSSSTVLITGESGTGKELVARAVHDLSPRRGGPFVSLNVSAIPDTLMESYLFGHERGAFTGADRRRDGLFRAATGGTLFLDEIGELSLAMQAKLLRATETREILPVGSDRSIKIDTRIVAATHRDLAAMVQQDRFRRDLLYRLSVIQAMVPPLRERREDVRGLALYLISRHAREQKKEIAGVSPRALQILERYSWPGNVRELSNVMERAVLLTEAQTIDVEDLPIELQALEDIPEPPLLSPPPQPSSDQECNLEAAALSFERAHIAHVLQRARGNREAAAKLLGLSPATLYRHLQRTGLKGFRYQPDE